MSHPVEKGANYRFSVWRSGKAWAAHARSDFEFFRQYGFETEQDAEAWAREALEEMKRNDGLLEESRVRI